MTYSEAVDYILDIPKFTKKNDAAHTKAFLKTLGDPQRKMRIIHVAGTEKVLCARIWTECSVRNRNERGFLRLPIL